MSQRERNSTVADTSFDPEAVLACQGEFRVRLEEAATAQDVSPDVRRMLTFLNENLFNHGLTAGRACSECGFSDHNFATTFKRQVGVGMSEYISNKRMEMARVLLEINDLPVMEIGWLVGYDYPETFSRAFRRVVGQSAMQYRRALKKSEN